MELSKELYVGDKVESLGSIVYALRRNLPLLHVYCLCKAKTGKHIAIVSARELVRARNADREYLIFGVAQGKKEAYGLLVQIIAEATASGYPVERLWAYLEENGVQRDEA